ncbi:PHD domain-containing protein [Heracleum sosnowskyi]|uniref:PHD domain-containing protein n=1 Tax=Heracleum sosnowskyi TaxID=360622 RepID=A0AAD8IWN7_9APIA|nr:PHD domain-containing protein [Heracleum sosnowskyi]
MRSQARWDHRTPDPVDPPDDWVNGSWTVDCVCGVNFDDGEEMVNCDECGVWVHTRCYRYVKSEKSFACYKCKGVKSRRDCESDRIEEEERTESEVAQLLVELPNKTLRRSLGSSGGNSGGFQKRLWTQIPKEERVHVQGVPGGEDGVFCGSGLSSVFGAGLWKSSGYVPKKFSFQYKEFDCWNEGDENVVNNGDVSGQGVSLLKDGAGFGGDHVSLGVGTRTRREESKRKKGEGEDCDGRSAQKSGMKQKDRSLNRSTIIHYGKRKKEVSKASKDGTGKKKARVVHVEGDASKKRSPRASRSASTPSSDAKQSAFHESRGFKVDESVTESGKHEKVKENVPAEPSSKGFSTESVEVAETKNTLAISAQTPETTSVLSTQRLSLKARPSDNCGLNAPFQPTSIVSDSLQSSLDHSNSRCLPAKTEDVVLGDMNVKKGFVGRSDQTSKEHHDEYMETIAPRVKDSQNDHDSNGKMSLGRSKQKTTHVDINDSGGVSHVSLPCDRKLDDAGPAPHPQHHDLHLNVLNEAACVNDVHFVDQKVRSVDTNTVAANLQFNKAVTPSEPAHVPVNGQMVHSDNPVAGGSSLKLKQVRHSKEPSESCETTLISSEHLDKHKVVVSFGKSSSTTATTLLSKTPASDSHRVVDAQNHNCSPQQNAVSEHKTGSKKDGLDASLVKDGERNEKPRKMAKEVPKSFTSSMKTSNLSKIPEDTTPSELMQRSEAVNNLNCQPSLKINHTPQMHHSAVLNTSAAISDEELALLLHHELNSSPRVPRVPRMRHAGSLPQLGSPTGANSLMKRSSSSCMGKDHGLVFKRKGKSIAAEGSQNSEEDESKNVKRSPLLPVQRTNDQTRTSDSVTKREVDYGSAAGVQSLNKSISHATSLNAGNASLASAETGKQDVSSTYKSPRNASDDNAGSEIRPAQRTLPGLLSMIMTKRMTYEELCNAVLPHWPHLRKHNGERYAYSSHSQAVLDCLRNRSEWARLVDRGPKTNAGRKRRRSDAEAQSLESEDNESKKKDTKGVDSKSVVESCQDQFPKGKRKARKRRRRLALQGRGLKNMVFRRGRKQKEADDISYDEEYSLSSSSSAEESMSTEDETIQGGGGTSSAAGRSEASASE